MFTESDATQQGTAPRHRNMQANWTRQLQRRRWLCMPHFLRRDSFKSSLLPQRAGMERRTKAAALSIAIGSVKRLSRRHRHRHRQQRLHRKFSADQLCSSFSCIAPQRRTRMCNRVYVFIDKIDINRTFKAICCKIFIACKLPTASRCLSSIRFFDANLHTCHIRTFSIILYALQTHA